MKKTIFSLLFAASFIGAQAQYSGQVQTTMSSGGSQAAGNAAMIQGLLGPISDAKSKRTFNLDDFKGSPYTSNDFRLTSLYYKDDLIGQIFYRYNALNQEVEIKVENKEDEGIRGLARDKALKIMVDGKPLSFKTFIDKEDRTQNGYLITLVDGDEYKLYKRIFVKYTEGMKAQNSFVPATPSKFTHFEEYYFQPVGVNRIDVLKNKNSSLVKRVKSEDKAALKTVLKEKNLNVRNERELIFAVQQLNAL